jgi:hypothetical protein
VRVAILMSQCANWAWSSDSRATQTILPSGLSMSVRWASKSAGRILRIDRSPVPPKRTKVNLELLCMSWSVLECRCASNMMAGKISGVSGGLHVLIVVPGDAAETKICAMREPPPFRRRSASHDDRNLLSADNAEEPQDLRGDSPASVGGEAGCDCLAVSSVVLKYDSRPLATEPKQQYCQWPSTVRSAGFEDSCSRCLSGYTRSFLAS